MARQPTVLANSVIQWITDSSSRHSQSCTKTMSTCSFCKEMSYAFYCTCSANSHTAILTQKPLNTRFTIWYFTKKSTGLYHQLLFTTTATRCLKAPRFGRPIWLSQSVNQPNLFV